MATKILIGVVLYLIIGSLYSMFRWWAFCVQMEAHQKNPPMVTDYEATIQSWTLMWIYHVWSRGK
jgi:hypothetical protein